jgi:HK97 family phage prohead protease
MIRFTASPVSIEAAPEGDGKRQIMGVAAPYNVEATVSDGTTVKFLPGSLPVDGPAPKLIQNHDLAAAIGVVTERVEDENGMYFVARISKTAAGNDALELAKDGVLDAVSVGAEPITAEYDENGTLVIAQARWIELSLVPLGAFPQAVVTQVAAAQAKEKQPMSEIQNQSKVETVAAEAPAPAPTAPIWAAAKTEREYPMPSAAEYLAAYHAGGQTWQNVNAAYRQNVAKSQTAIQAALAQDLTTDTPGLLPTPVLGPVFVGKSYVAPFLTEVGTRAMPNGNGKSFIRPTFTQYTSQAVQTEGSAVSSTKAIIASNSVTRTTIAGGVFISQQDIDFTDPAALSAILDDLAGEYLIKADDVAVDACVAGANTHGVWDGTPEGLIAILYNCAKNISNGTNLFPTHIVMGPDTWAKIGSLVDSTNRPVFPAVGAPNLSGFNTLGAGDVTNWTTTNPLGLRTIVDSNVAAKTMVVFHGPGMEIYQNVRGIMTKEDPELLGRNFTYYGYLATFIPKADLLQKCTWV